MNEKSKQQNAIKHAEYVNANLIRKEAKFNRKTEPDLVEWVESLETPYQTYVKRLIRDDMNKKKQETELVFPVGR